MMDALISVVIPTYNYARFVGAAVESALRQTYCTREIIVVDDGSTDDTRRVLAPYEGRIRYVYQNNQGLSAARNSGIRAAGGKFIALLDSDDLWHPQKLELQMKYLAEHPEVGALGCTAVSEFSRHWPAIDCSKGLKAHEITLERFVLDGRLGPSSAVIARECFERVGYFDTTLRLAEDQDMWQRIASQYPVRKLDAPLWWYRVHATSLSRVTATLEQCEFQVLRRAFATNPKLRGRPLLRQRALSFAARSAAIGYSMSGQDLRALSRVLESIVRWPLPNLTANERYAPFQRYKHLTVIMLRLLRLKQQARPPKEQLADEPVLYLAQPIDQGVETAV